jgi:hypothetical protein
MINSLFIECIPVGSAWLMLTPIGEFDLAGGEF